MAEQTDWSFNFNEGGWVGVIDVLHDNGKSLARIGSPDVSYGDIARFKRFAEHYSDLRAERDTLLAQRKELLGAVDVVRPVIEQTARLRENNVKNWVDCGWEDDEHVAPHISANRADAATLRSFLVTAARISGDAK